MLNKLSCSLLIAIRPARASPLMCAASAVLTVLMVFQASQVPAAPQGQAPLETISAKQGPATLLMKDYSPFAPTRPGESASPRITGPARIDSIDWTAHTASIAVGGVSSAAGTPRGQLALELWFLDEPYTGGAVAGHRMASLPLPEGCAEGCPAITSGALTVTPPSAGTYYAAIALVTNDAARCGSSQGTCTLDAVALGDPQTVPGVASGGIEGAGSPVAAGPIVLGGTTGTVTFHFNPDTVDLTLGSITNTRTAESGTIRIVVELSSMQYVSGQAYSGYQVATTNLPPACTIDNGQLAAGTVCSNITATGLAATYPSPGSYYAATLVEEYETAAECADSTHYCVNDGVNAQGQVTVPAPSSGGDSGGVSGDGGGGAVDGTTLVLGASLLLGRLVTRRKRVGNCTGLAHRPASPAQGL